MIYIPFRLQPPKISMEPMFIPRDNFLNVPRVLSDDDSFASDFSANRRANSIAQDSLAVPRYAQPVRNKNKRPNENVVPLADLETERVSSDSPTFVLLQ